MRTVLLALPALAVLCACSGVTSTSDVTNSGFVSASPFGAINVGLTQTLTNGLTDDDGEGFAFQTGDRIGAGFEAVSALIPGTDVTFRPSTGTGTYTGAYSVGVISDIAIVGDFVEGSQLEGIGLLTLNVNFASGAVAGQSDDGLLTVDGGLSGRDLSGSVTFLDVPGTLDGLVGGDQAFGIFHGNDPGLVYAGGFIADRD